MKKIVIVLKSILLCTLLGCVSVYDNMVLEEKTAIEFIKSNDYKLLYRKDEIPAPVLKILTDKNAGEFRLGDRTDSLEISYSDMSLGQYKYNKGLKFMLLNESICIMVYTSGGVGRHDVVDFIRYKTNVSHVRYTSITSIDSPDALLNFFEETIR